MSLLDKNIKNFALRVFYFFSPLILPVLFLLGLGVYSGELWPISYVLDYEYSHPRNILFLKEYFSGSDRNAKYQEMLKRNPEVLMIGSSRTLTFREEMFGSADFYNAGRLVQNYQDLLDFLEHVFPKINPKIIYFGVDWYLLGDRTYSHETKIDPSMSDDVYNWRAEMYFFRRFLGDLIKDPSLISRIIYRQLDMVSGKIPIGIRAFYGDGIRFDGSMQFGTILKRRRDNPVYVDAVTPTVLDQVRGGLSYFKFDNQVSQNRIDTIKKFLQNAKERNIQVVGFSSPYSAEVYRELTTSPFYKEFFAASRKKISEIFEEAGMPYFDFHDLASLGIDDQYMLDGAHMGDTASAILIRAMVSDLDLHAYLDEKINQKTTTSLEIIW